MSRKQTDDWAVLAVTPEKLTQRVNQKGLSVRATADLCGHASHSHLYRLMTGRTRTTSVRTADVLEAVLDARGLLFARMSAKPAGRAVA